MNSIQRQLTRKLVQVIAVLMSLGLIAIYIVIWQVLGTSRDTALHTQALAVSALTESESGQVQFDFSDDFLDDFGAEHVRSYFEIRGATGKLLTHSRSLQGALLPFRTGGTPEQPVFWDFTLPNGNPARAAAFAFSPKAADNTPVTAKVPSVRLVT